MIYGFGEFALDEERCELRRAGAPIKIEPKAFRVLAYLIQHRERVVARDELFKQFWSGEFVTDSALAHCIVKARQAVDDGGVTQRVIKTVHGHGYRFIAAVGKCRLDAATPAVPPVPPPSIAEQASPPPVTPEPRAHRHQTGHRLPEGERKEVTVLSVGVKGISALA